MCRTVSGSTVAYFLPAQHRTKAPIKAAVKPQVIKMKPTKLVNDDISPPLLVFSLARGTPITIRPNPIPYNIPMADRLLIDLYQNINYIFYRADS